MSTDVRKLAKLLQAKAPPGHKLAFINDDEAALLKRRGGSGRITEAGIPSYEDTYYSDPTSEQGLQPVDTTPAPAPTPAPDISVQNATPSQNISSGPSTDAEAQPGGFYGQGSTTPAGYGGFDTTLGTQPTPQLSSVDQGLASLGAAQAPPSEASYTPPPGATAYTELPSPPPSTPSTFDKLTSALTSPKGVAAGLGLAQGLYGAQQIKKAQGQGQQAASQLGALGAPLQQQGLQNLALAQQGQLTPANQQVLQAARAQLQQGIASRGGVGVQQATNQLTNIQQVLLAQQQAQAQSELLQGNQYVANAIKTGLQNDQYVNQLSNAFSQNLLRTLSVLAGASPNVLGQSYGQPQQVQAPQA